MHTGQEFQAVFLSTTEPINEDGYTCNPTKCPCDPYVFNTVLTRAKSLVVVVGSPLVLLNIEEHMVKLYGDKGKCWSCYLKSCLDNDTLIIPSFVAEPHQSTSVKFKEVLTFKLIHATVPQTFQSSRHNSDDSGYSGLSSASSTHSLESSISDVFWPVSEVN